MLSSALSPPRCQCFMRGIFSTTDMTPGARSPGYARLAGRCNSLLLQRSLKHRLSLLRLRRFCLVVHVMSLLVWVFGSMPLVETLPVADWLPQIPRLLASFG